MDFARSVPDDARGIAELEERCFPDPWSQRDITDLITTEGAMCFTAREGTRVVAYVIGRLIAPEGEIYRVAVDEAYRHRGIAYRLLDYAAKTSRGKGLESLFLEVRSKNLAAVSLYRSYGFKEIGRRRNYYKDPTDDAIVMLKASRADML
ncbi:MAG: ribosomal protein S18-alanine N-acetyltransferase [Clostridia bacterium]|nr:ribosomal protein S18-alanine N-acetyltransferase [Clostridia bacterium]